MQFLRLPAVVDRTGLPRSTLYRLCRLGRFPRPTKLSERCSAWSANEVDRWLSDRLAERDIARDEAGVAGVRGRAA